MMATLLLLLQVTLSAVEIPLTGTGVASEILVPLPSWPSEFPPQH
jgi:hypothetical protein